MFVTCNMGSIFSNNLGIARVIDQRFESRLFCSQKGWYLLIK